MTTVAEPTHTWQTDTLSVQRGPRTVLHDVTVSLGSGECITLIGPNGSGKTTLMLTLLGLLPASGGRVALDNRDMHAWTTRQRGRLAAYVPQVVERLPGFRVWDVVAGGRYPHLSSWQPMSPDDERIIVETLQQCGLADLAERSVTELSGGERQKVLLAAAIAQDAAMLFLDEPNTALDPAYQVELVRLLRAWHARGRGVVLISHDLHLPAALGGRVIALRDGRIVADGPASEVLDADRLEAIYNTPFETATTADGQRVVLPKW